MKIAGNLSAQIIAVAILTAGTTYLLNRSDAGFPGINPRPVDLEISEVGFAASEPPELVYVSGGILHLGDPTGEFAGGLPGRHVTISSFYISKCEITFADYDLYCAATGTLHPPDGGRGRGNRPAGNVSWFDAAGYCNWLSRWEGLTPCYRIIDGIEGGLPDIAHDYQGDGYRLPTEYEWEFAASGGNFRKGFMYAGSDDVGEVAWYFDNGGRYPEPVGKKKPNELGLFDMSGNVYEWTDSWTSRDYTDIADDSADPIGPQAGLLKVIRGGSCFFDSWGCRVWYRKTQTPDSRVPYTGFRIVRNAE